MAPRLIAAAEGNTTQTSRSRLSAAASTEPAQAAIQALVAALQAQPLTRQATMVGPHSGAAAELTTPAAAGPTEGTAQTLAQAYLHQWADVAPAVGLQPPAAPFTSNASAELSTTSVFAAEARVQPAPPPPRLVNMQPTFLLDLATQPRSSPGAAPPPPPASGLELATALQALLSAHSALPHEEQRRLLSSLAASGPLPAQPSRRHADTSAPGGGSPTSAAPLETAALSALATGLPHPALPPARQATRLPPEPPLPAAPHGVEFASGAAAAPVGAGERPGGDGKAAPDEERMAENLEERSALALFGEDEAGEDEEGDDEPLPWYKRPWLLFGLSCMLLALLLLGAGLVLHLALEGSSQANVFRCVFVGWWCRVRVQAFATPTMPKRRTSASPPSARLASPAKRTFPQMDVLLRGLAHPVLRAVLPHQKAV
jgi:hypothetical protein